MPRKAPASPVSALWGHRLPPPLAPLPDSPAAHAAVYAFLRAGGGDADIARRFASPDADLRACVARYLDDPAAFDPGDAPWDEARVVALDPSQKRAYKRSHAAAAKAQSERAWGLYYATRAARAVPELLARVLAAFPTASLRGRFEIARSLFADEPPTDPEVLTTLSGLVHDPVTHESTAAMALGTRALVALDPARALQQLSAWLVMPEAAEPAVQPRTIGIVLGLHATPHLDPGWAEALRPLFVHPALACYAAYPLATFDLDDSWRATLLGHLLRDPRSPNAFDVTSLALLARVANAETVPVFVNALRQNNAAALVALDGIARAADPSARPAVEAWIAHREAAGHAPDWEPLVRARAVCAALSG